MTVAAIIHGHRVHLTASLFRTPANDERPVVPVAANDDFSGDVA